MSKPNYRNIYFDYIQKNTPEKIGLYEFFFRKKEITSLDVIKINKLLFPKPSLLNDNKYKSYDKKTIYEILDYQIKNNLNNTQLSLHFNISRNTIAAWKKMKKNEF